MEKCPKCGAPVNREDGRFCGNCGCPLDEQEEAIQKEEIGHEDVAVEIAKSGEEYLEDYIEKTGNGHRADEENFESHTDKINSGRQHDAAKKVGQVMLILVFLLMPVAVGCIAWGWAYEEPESSVWVRLSDIPAETGSESEYAFFHFDNDEWDYFCGDRAGQDNVVTFTLDGEYLLLTAVLVAEEGCGYDSEESAKFEIYADGKLLYKKQFDGEACEEPFCIEISKAEQIEMHLPGDAKIHLADAWLVRK